MKLLEMQTKQTLRRLGRLYADLADFAQTWRTLIDNVKIGDDPNLIQKANNIELHCDALVYLSGG